MPERTCIACRTKSHPAGFLRLGLQAPGTVGVWSGKGRSAYVCAKPECLDEAMKKGRLERALRSSLDPSTKARLRDELLCQLR